MKVRLSNIVDSLDALKELSSLKFKAAKSFQFAKFIKQANSELQEFVPIRTATLLKYSSDGKKVDDDKVAQADAELKELLSKEIDCPELTLKESELEPFEISPGLLVQLEWLITKD